MSYGISFTDRDGGSLKLPGSWRITLSSAGQHQLIGEGAVIDLPASIFSLDPRLSPEQLAEIRQQVEAASK
ncbi:hypothetical protein BFW86_16855 [Pseudomonas fluorescens]|nr:hypothetical protein BFW86_16855 [Pseudomonas fluorescens]